MSCLYLAVTGDITDKHIVNLFAEAFVKIIDKAPSVPHHYDCNHDCDAIYKAYQKGREDAFLKTVFTFRQSTVRRGDTSTLKTLSQSRSAISMTW